MIEKDCKSCSVFQTLVCLDRNSNESVLSLSTLKWPFILLILYYLKVSSFKIL